MTRRRNIFNRFTDQPKMGPDEFQRGYANGLSAVKRATTEEELDLVWSSHLHGTMDDDYDKGYRKALDEHRAEAKAEVKAKASK
jgi:hypothetical protein